MKNQACRRVWERFERFLNGEHITCLEAQVIMFHFIRCPDCRTKRDQAYSQFKINEENRFVPVDLLLFTFDTVPDNFVPIPSERLILPGHLAVIERIAKENGKTPVQLVADIIIRYTEEHI